MSASALNNQNANDCMKDAQDANGKTREYHSPDTITEKVSRHIWEASNVLRSAILCNEETGKSTVWRNRLFPMLLCLRMVPITKRVLNSLEKMNGIFLRYSTATFSIFLFSIW